MGVRWNTANGVTFETPNKDFVSHIGVRFQLDSVWFDQDHRLSAPAGGIGDLEDGVFFRRIRPSWDGQAYEVFEWNVELLLENLGHNVIGLDDVWAGVQKLPLIGTARIGHMHLPQGLEGDMYGSSKNMTFLERSMYTDAFEQNLGTGIWLTNSILDQRATWAFEAYRQDNYNGDNWGANNGVSFGDGKMAFIGRATALPIYENDGRCLMHVGLAGSWRKAEDVNVSTGLPGGAAGQGQTVGPTFVQFRARPQLRDAIGDYGSNAAGPGLPGNSARLVDTGVMLADSSAVISPEFLYVRGPFSLQAEYAWAVSDNTITAAATNVRPGTKVGTHLGDVWFNGGYIQASYFLTGENRLYDRRLGRLGAPYIATPYTPFFLTRDEDGKFIWGRGAWEVAVRWNHLNLNSGAINGGESDALEVGLNWYLSNNLKIQFEYLHQDRYGLKKGVNPGDLDGLGIRTQFFF
jgi:phosphate-selective porin OprO/OprP